MRILAIGDLHLPYCSKEKVSKMLDLVVALKPTHIVQMGDLYDLYSYSKFPRSIKLLKADEEIAQGRVAAEEIWTGITNRAKKAAKYQLVGNHDARPFKRMRELCPELEPFCDFTSLWTFPGVTTIADSRETLEIGDFSFIHGHKTQWLAHVRRMNTNVCFAHTHRGGCLSYPLGGRTLFELNCGFLADPYHEALLYRELKQFHDWTHGVGFIDELGPRFISL